MLGNISAGSMLGLGVGLLVGVGAGLLMAPMRGREMRSSLRTRADEALNRGMKLIEEGRHALRTSETQPRALTATLGEIAEMHAGAALPSEARS